MAHNKLLAKLCSNMHKPNAQTVLPLDKVEVVFHTLPVERVRGWGGKFGVKMMEKLGVSTAGEASRCLVSVVGGRVCFSDVRLPRNKRKPSSLERWASPLLSPRYTLPSRGDACSPHPLSVPGMWLLSATE